MSPFIWVDTNRKLQAAQKDIAGSALIGIDTEYDSFRYFREKLCLIQIKTDHKTYLFDPLNDLDISFLGTCFADPATPKILHAGDNDIRLLNRDYRFKFETIFDTQKAAALLGHKQLSLATVIHQTLGIELLKAKRIQRSQWDIRPLSDEQKEYAAQDIEHLLALYKKLNNDLEANGLKETAEQAFREIALVKWNEKIYDPFGYFRIDGYKTLKKPQKERLKRLYEWRFQKAKATNTAVFMILSDQNLVDLAHARGTDLNELHKAGRLSEGRIHKFGSEIIGLLNTANDADLHHRSTIKA